MTGELKGLGGYVVGPGSFHPSGKKYSIYKDVDIAPLPPGLCARGGERQRKISSCRKRRGNSSLRGIAGFTSNVKSGKLRNMGLDEDGIYNALRDFAENNCEDGANYPDEKLKEIAHAAFNKFDAITRPRSS